MNCRECRELLVSHLEGVLFQREGELVAEHLDGCAECRKELKAVAALRDRLLRDGQRAKAAGFTASVMSKILLEKDFRKAKEKNMFQRHPLRISLAAAAAIATAVGLVAVLTPRAYALSDTLKANEHITSLHFLNERPGKLTTDANGKPNYVINTSVYEGWAEYGENGELLRLRMEFPYTEDGAKVTVWQNGKATVWFKDKKDLATLSEPNMAKMVGDLRRTFDPKLTMERLKDAESKGKVHVTTQEPIHGDLLPIVLIAQWSEPASLKEIYLVDYKTNLVHQIETFGLTGDFISRMRFLDYNQPIPDSVFTLNPPEDVARVDQTTQEIGLPKSNLSDNEISQKVAREFFEALIAKDYAKAGLLYEGVSAKEMEKGFGDAKFTRIVSIGTPTPSPANGGGAVHVPCEVEIEVNGLKSTKTFNPGVRQVYSHPDRWDIFGGI